LALTFRIPRDGVIIGRPLDASTPELNAREFAMPSSKPEDWPSQFSQHLDAGDLEAILALYEPEARFVPRSGETIVGRERIRDVLAGLIRSGTKLQGRVIQAVSVDDIAILYTDFEGTTVDASGNTVDLRSKAIEVLRRQPDGTWQLIIGDPNGRE
jgi:uncharacterized protein (TIGR02246 family)